MNSIFKKQDKHILINYVYDYPKATLYEYTMIVLNELKKRNVKVRSFLNFNKYFQMLDKDSIYFNDVATFKEHDDQYLLICFMNLYEKYIRGQKDFTDEIFYKLYDYVNTKFDLKELGLFE